MAKQYLVMFVFALACSLVFSNASGTRWCIAKPSTPDYQLQNNIDFACANLKDCKLIEFGGPCFIPSNKISNSSVVMNLYFKYQGSLDKSCDFNGSGLIVYNDPSVGACRYLA